MIGSQITTTARVACQRDPKRKPRRATLELFDVRHDTLIDGIEIGGQLDTRVQIALQVDDLENAARSVKETGADPMAPAVETRGIATSGSVPGTGCR